MLRQSSLVPFTVLGIGWPGGDRWLDSGYALQRWLFVEMGDDNVDEQRDAIVIDPIIDRCDKVPFPLSLERARGIVKIHAECSVEQCRRKAAALRVLTENGAVSGLEKQGDGPIVD